MVEKKANNYHKYEFKMSNKGSQKILITSDWHFDNPKCNRNLLFKHLDQAKRENAKIIINGDMLCLMQGKYDPRRSKSDVRPEHNVNNYLDIVIIDTVEKLLPYAKNILQINSGNHESSVSHRSETNILDRLVERLNTKANTNIQRGAYMGYITLSFHYDSGNSKSKYRTVNIGYTHGNFGGVITKGVLSVVRMASIMPDADIVISGHTHDGWVVPHPQYKMNRFKNKVEVKNQWHVKSGTYKEEFEKGEGWAVEKIAMAKYLGSCWMDIFYDSHKDLEYTFTLTH